MAPGRDAGLGAPLPWAIGTVTAHDALEHNVHRPRHFWIFADSPLFPA
jgi:hypothetical protein